MSKYTKEMPGAETLFRPGNLNEYADLPWDIRISIGNAPLEEAFFFSINSLEDAKRPIRELLEQFALNSEREPELDLLTYPELPFLQQELIQCYEAAKQKQFPLAVYVNQHPEPIDLEQPAETFLSTCVFRNKSWDYVVLDLIFELGTPAIDETERMHFCERHTELKNASDLKEQAHELTAKYEKYGSVSVAPFALGIPEGFDVRLQMMDFDELDPERCVLIQLLADESIELADAFEQVIDALAYKTNFSAEIMTGLKECGTVLENA